MTSREAKSAIGRTVTERGVVCEVGELTKVIHVPGGDGRRSEFAVRVAYPTGERVVPLSVVQFSRAGRPASPGAPCPTPAVTALMAAMRRVFFPGPKVMDGTPREYHSQDAAFAGAFLAAVGRLPTAAELDHMTGGTEVKTCPEPADDSPDDAPHDPDAPF